MSTEPHHLTRNDEPATGAVVAIGWGTDYPEIWAADRSNIGNWYAANVPFDGRHPTWDDVVSRAHDRQLPLVLLVAADDDAWKAGFRAGVEASGRAVENLL